MFLLDTNVVSELLRPSPDAGVETWVGDLPATDLYFSAIGEAEPRYGVAILPTGRRQAALPSATDVILREDFGNRILPFDSHAARELADIAAARRSAGRTVAPSDCQTTLSRDKTVVTRNVRHFAHMDIEVVNPWTGY